MKPIMFLIFFHLFICFIISFFSSSSTTIPTMSSFSLHSLITKFFFIFIFFFSFFFFFFLYPLLRIHYHEFILVNPIKYQKFNSSNTPLASPGPSPGHGNAEPPADSSSKNIVLDVISFGAVGDGITDDTAAFKIAWDSACDSNDPTIILVPSGFCYLVKPNSFNGPCRATIVLQIDGSVIPPDGPETWPSGYEKQWLMFYGVNGLSLQGCGLIDGRGHKWWDLPCKPHKGINKTIQNDRCDSPVAIRFFQSSNLVVQGLSVNNSPQFHFRFDNCSDVIVDSLAITSPALSPNTDGIHIENTKNLQIRNSVISNGDDCVSIGAGSINVNIQNITCGPSHGISIGSLGVHNSHACVSDITITDSVIKNSDNGARIKTWQGGTGSVSRVLFRNIQMDNVRNPIIIDQYYCQTQNCTNQTSAVIITDILYANIKGTHDTRSPPVHFACSDSVPCSDLNLVDVELLPSIGQFVADPFCWNAYGSVQRLTIPPVYCLLENFTGFSTEDDVYRC